MATSPSFQEFMDAWQQSQADPASELDFMNQEEQQPGYFEREIMRTPEDRSKEMLDQYLRMNYGAKPGAGVKKNILPTIAAAIGELGKSVSKGKDYVNPADAAMKAGRQEYQSLLPYASREQVSRQQVVAANKRAIMSDKQKREALEAKKQSDEVKAQIATKRNEMANAIKEKQLALDKEVAANRMSVDESKKLLNETKAAQAQQLIDFQEQLGLFTLATDPKIKSGAILDTVKTGENPNTNNVMDIYRDLWKAQNAGKGSGSGGAFGFLKGAKTFTNPQTGKASLLTVDGKVIPVDSIPGLEDARPGVQTEGERKRQEASTTAGSKALRLADLIMDPEVMIGPMQGPVSSVRGSLAGTKGPLGVSPKTIDMKQISGTLVNDFAREKSGAAIPEWEWKRLEQLMPTENTPREAAALKLANVLEERLKLDQKYTGSANFKGRDLEDVQQTIGSLRDFAAGKKPAGPNKDFQDALTEWQRRQMKGKK